MNRRARRIRRGAWYTAACLVGLLLSAPAQAQYLRIRDICRVKGQEENTLHGLGLVVGLAGTGDGDTPTFRALARTMELMGSSLAIDANRQPQLNELKNAKNVALVFVTATIPPEGARQGETLNCVVNAVSAKSLAGGHLLPTPLLGPRPGNPRVYAFAQGSLASDSSGPTTAARVHAGCRLEEDVFNMFVRETTAGKLITLVLDNSHASFSQAFELAEALNNPGSSGISVGRGRGAEGLDRSQTTHDIARDIARPIDQVNVEVRVPDEYQDHLVEFVASVLDTQIIPPRHDARVVIDERNGVIIIGDNVLVGRVAVTQQNLAIKTGDAATGGPFFEIDQANNTSTTRLKALVDALNALKVETKDVIAIIKSLERSGDLYGRVVVQ